MAKHTILIEDLRSSLEVADAKLRNEGQAAIDLRAELERKGEEIIRLRREITEAENSQKSAEREAREAKLREDRALSSLRAEEGAKLAAQTEVKNVEKRLLALRRAHQESLYGRAVS